MSGLLTAEPRGLALSELELTPLTSVQLEADFDQSRSLVMSNLGACNRRQLGGRYTCHMVSQVPVINVLL